MLCHWFVTLYDSVRTQQKSVSLSTVFLGKRERERETPTLKATGAQERDTASRSTMCQMQKAQLRN